MPLSFAAYPRRIALAALSAALAALVWGDSGDAQVRTPDGGQVLTPDPAIADAAPNGGVYVSDSAVAVDKMALATRLEKLKEWSKSADVYQEITEKYRDRVVPLGVDDQGVVDQYTSVLTLVNQHLRTWPPEGLTVYRDRFELTAKKLVDSARGDDLAPLHEAFDLYFATDSGKAAGLKLIDAYIELGDFPAATWIGQELLNHPNLTVERPGVLFRVGLAAHLAGDDKTAQAMLGELKDKFSNVIGTIRGGDVTLADELGAELAKAPVESETPDQTGDSWPMIGGDASRGKIAASPARPGAKLYAIDLAQPNWKKNVATPAERAESQAYDQTFRHDGKAMGVLPVADRGQLFFQNNAQVYAVNLETGAPLPGWLATYPQSHGQYERPKAWNMPNGRPFTVSLTDSDVIAVMGQEDAISRLLGHTAGQEATVVCLDRQTGRENWAVGARDLPDENLHSLVFDGSALVVGNGVFLAARGFKNNGYEDSYVICLDLSSGAFRWSCYVASAPSGGSVNGNSGSMALGFEAATHLSYASGRVFVSTNLGAVAALDAYSGSVAWLNIYRDASDTADPNLMMVGPMARGFGGFPGGWGAGMPVQQNPPPLPSPWTANAAIVHGGNVFVLPTDGKYILVYDAGNGRTVKKIKKSDCPPPSIDDDPADPSASEPNALLGVMDQVPVNDHGTVRKEDLLLLGTPSHIVAINWRDYSLDQPTPPPWVALNLNGGSILGRAFLTSDSVYVPTSNTLDRVAIRTGTLVEAYPSGAAWPPNEEPGNVIVCGDQIVVAGQQRVSVYSDLKFAQSRLDAQIAAAPADPELRLRYAEIMFLADQPKLAAQKLDEAAGLLAGASGPADRAVGNQAFSDAIEFAMKSWLGNADDAQVGGLFDRAMTLAKTPSQQANYRLTRARYEHFGAHDLSAAINLYQGILASDAQRTVAAAESIIEDPLRASASDDNNALQNQAWQVAATAIARIQSEPNGAEAYKPFEQAAASQFDAAQKARDADAEIKVAREYPNASVSANGTALLAAAKLYDSMGRAADAARLWQELYSRANDRASQVAILQYVARNELKLPGGLEAADSRLSAAIRLDPGATLAAPLILPGGQKLSGTFEEARRAIDTLVKETAATSGGNLPDIGLPPRPVARAYRAAHQPIAPFLADDTASDISGVDKLLMPAQLYARNDRLTAWTNGQGLSIYPVGKSAALGTDASVADEPRGAAWVEDYANLLTWTKGSLHLVDGDQAKSRWTLDLASLGDLDVMAEPAPRQEANLINSPDRMMMRRMQRSQLWVTPQFQLNLPDVGGGGSGLSDDTDDASAVTAGPESITQVVPVGDMALVATSSGRVAAVKISDGSVVWQNRLADRAVSRLEATGDFTVVLCGDDAAARLVVLNTTTGELIAHKVFTADSYPGQPADFPINLALGGDGTLAYTLEDRVVLCDLYEAGRDENGHESGLDHVSPTPELPGKPQLFEGMNKPGQLVIHAGQVLALAEGGRTLCGYTVDGADFRRFEVTDDQKQVQSVQMVLAAGGGDDQAQLRIGGRYIYSWGSRWLTAYNLDNPETSWGPPEDLQPTPGSTGNLLLGRDYLVMLNQPPDAGAWRMWAFWRAPVPGKPTEETGALVYQMDLGDPHGIIAAEAVDGGVVYLDGDHTLHFLRGNRVPPALGAN